MDPKIRRDNGGPTNSSLRLAIPAWMVGGDTLGKRQVNYEVQSLEEKSKAVHMTPLQQKAIVDSCRTGFSASLPSALDTNFTEPKVKTDDTYQRHE